MPGGGGIDASGEDATPDSGDSSGGGPGGGSSPEGGGGADGGSAPAVSNDFDAKVAAASCSRNSSNSPFNAPISNIHSSFSVSNSILL